MAGLVLVATAGDSDANTYCTLAEAEAYMLEYVHKTDWDAASDDTKNAALTQATRDIDSHRLYGTKYDDTQDDDGNDNQSLHFPITEIGAYIPARLKRACALQAAYIIRNGAAAQATFDLMSTGLSSQGAGRLSESYNRSAASVLCAEARALIGIWIVKTVRVDRG